MLDTDRKYVVKELPKKQSDCGFTVAGWGGAVLPCTSSSSTLDPQKPTPATFQLQSDTQDSVRVFMPRGGAKGIATGLTGGVDLCSTHTRDIASKMSDRKVSVKDLKEYAKEDIKGKDSNDGHSFDAVDHGFLQAGSDTHAEAAKDGQSDIVHLMATNARSQKTDVHGYLKDAIDDYKGFGEDYKDLDSAKGPSILGKKMVNDSTGTSATQHGSGRRGGGRGRRSMKY